MPSTGASTGLGNLDSSPSACLLTIQANSSYRGREWAPAWHSTCAVVRGFQGTRVACKELRASTPSSGSRSSRDTTRGTAVTVSTGSCRSLLGCCTHSTAEILNICQSENKFRAKNCYLQSIAVSLPEDDSVTPNITLSCEFAVQY